MSNEFSAATGGGDLVGVDGTLLVHNELDLLDIHGQRVDTFTLMENTSLQPFDALVARFFDIPVSIYMLMYT